MGDTPINETYAKEQQEAMDIKFAIDKAIQAVNNSKAYNEPRIKALVKTKLEEADMWSNKLFQ